MQTWGYQIYIILVCSCEWWLTRRLLSHLGFLSLFEYFLTSKTANSVFLWEDLVSAVEISWWLIRESLEIYSMLRIKWSETRLIIFDNVADLRHRLMGFHFVLVWGIIELEVIRLSETHSCRGNVPWLPIWICILSQNFLPQILIPSIEDFGLVFRVVWKYSARRESAIISFSEGIVPDLRRNIHVFVKCSNPYGFLFQFSLVIDVALVYHASPLRHGPLELQLIACHSLKSSRAISSEARMWRSRIF